MKKFGFEPGPLVVAFVVGSLMETSMRQSLRIFGDDPTGFVTRPISGGIIAVIVLLVVLLPLAKILIARRDRGRAAAGEQPSVADALVGVGVPGGEDDAAVRRRAQVVPPGGGRGEEDGR